MKLRGVFIVCMLMLSASWLQAAEIPWVFKPLPEQPPVPNDNPITKEKIALGKQLFFDTRLSSSNTHSCNSCHNLSAGGEDGLSQPVGIDGRKGKRSTLTVWNAAYHTVYNWDGSAKTLEEQVQNHLLDKNVMGVAKAQMLVNQLKEISGYRQQFDAVFPQQGVTFDTIAKALATYERTLVTPNSPFDRFLRGDQQAISNAAQRGFNEFIEVRCASCHFWVNMAGPVPGLALQQGEGFYELFPNYPGTDYEKKFRFADDQGRYHFTKDKTDRRMWRMPSLRNVAVTAPYFHNGAIDTLDQAVRVMAKTQLGKELTQQQVNDIVAFLNTLTGEFPEQKLPRLPEKIIRTAETTD